MFYLKRLSKPYGKRSRLKITFHRHSVGKETTIKPILFLYDEERANANIS